MRFNIFPGVLISPYPDQEGNKLQWQKILSFIYPIYCDRPTLSASNTTTSTKFDKTLIRVLTQARHASNVKFNDHTDNPPTALKM